MSSFKLSEAEIELLPYHYPSKTPVYDLDLFIQGLLCITFFRLNFVEVAVQALPCLTGSPEKKLVLQEIHDK